MALRVMVQASSPIPLDVAFEVAPGELLALVGHSGSGKTTLLRTIAGLHRPSRARVVVNDAVWLETDTRRFVPAHRRSAGFVFQSSVLFPHLSALGNVMVAMAPGSTAARAAEARRLLERVKLDGLAQRRPAQLSGGQQQRVAIARALARQPEVLLLDEPFSALDRATREALRTELAALRTQLDMPVVLVTHDLDEARGLADRVLVIERGHQLAAGPAAEVMFDPAVLRALGIDDAGSVLAARVAAHEADQLTRVDTSAGPVWLPQVDGAPGDLLQIRILAREVLLSRTRPEGLSALNILPATVADVSAAGAAGVLVRLAVGTDQLLASVTRRSADAMGLAPGVSCFAILKSMSIARERAEADYAGGPRSP